MTELKPCPFCGVMPHIYWEAWKDISPDAGVWKLEANHKDSCYITHINGTNISGRSSARRLSQLVEWWNHREELFGNSEQLESGHEKDHVADPGKMVGDLISRQAAIEYLMTNMNWYDEDGYESDDDYKRECITDLINGVPSAQPERKKGKWIVGTVEHKYTHEHRDARQCSECGAMYFHYARQEDIEDVVPNFCPNCGADMRGKLDG